MITVDTEDPGTKEGVTMSAPRRNTKFLMFMIHVNYAIYGMSSHLQGGAFPFVSKKLGVDPTTWGYLQTTIAIAQLAGCPIFGRFGDLYGSRAAMTLTFVGMMVENLLVVMSFSGGIPLLFISRAPMLFIHPMTAFQMAASDLSDEKSRADALAKLNIVSTAGRILGPTIAGWLVEQYGESFTCLVAASMSGLCVALVWGFIPASTKLVDEETAETSSQKKTSLFDYREILRLLRIPVVAEILGIKMFCSVAFFLLNSMMPIIQMEVFKMSPQEYGYFGTYLGIVYLICFSCVSPLTKRFSDINVMRISEIFVTIGDFGLALSNNYWQAGLAFLPRCFGDGILATMINSGLSKGVSAQDTGGVMGLSLSAGHVPHMITPPIAAYLFETFGYRAIGVSCFAINSAMTVYLLRRKDAPST
ncbi:PREDICTED: solute carrier family 22 member 18-like [Branchiostoma belcheri]|uniref:Organic cation transporter-like protein 2 n=1 Tax=Branchiostoma belcheri TaxID=7741 RepID=A0A6P4ZPX2_BRABE|nr:PREDICTED: solute carrier family 22 member 18-like [Branchiostoma belcheri]